MGVSTFVQPDFTSQTATVYKTSIDGGVAVHHQIAGPFAPHEQSTPNLTVRLDAANFSNLVSRTTITHAAQNTGSLTAPSVDPRKDIVHVDRLTGDVGVETGAEAASPVDPTIPVGKLPVARINWTTSTTEITNTDLDDIRAIGSLGLGDAAVATIGVDVQADLDVPSQAEAEAGTATDERVWTAERVSQAIAALSGGGLELLGSFSPSGAASVDINSIIVPTFRKYLVYYNLIPATDNAQLWVRSSINNGGSFAAGGSAYDVAADFVTITGARTPFAGGANAEMEISAGQGIGSAATEGVNGWFLIHDPTDSATRTRIDFSTVISNGGTALRFSSGGAWRAAPEDNDSFRMLFSGGNMTGEVRVYGIVEA